MNGVSLTSPHPAASLRSLLLPAPGRLEVRDLLKSAQLELTYNGRGALFTAYLEIASTSSRRTVLLPSFHCPSAITPALMAGLKPIYYRIRPDLSVDEEHLWSKVTDDVAAVLIIDFFGTSTKLTSRRALQDRGIALVEDCSHSFYRSDDGSLRLAGHADSDYCVYSFWKIVPSGVGGALLRRQTRAGQPRRPMAPWSARMRAFKAEFEHAIEWSDRPLLKKVYSRAETMRLRLRPGRSRSISPETPTLEAGEGFYPVDEVLALSAIPRYALRIVESSDLADIAARRRANFLAFARCRQMMRPMRPLVASLAEDACPWVYPVLLEDRCNWDYKLRARGVALHTFGIYLHSTLFAQTEDQAMLADARYLARRILCLSIHQDLRPTDIARTTGIVASTLSPLLASA